MLASLQLTNTQEYVTVVLLMSGSLILLDIVLMLVVIVIYQLIAVATITFNEKNCVATN